jgi:hypothetical protein
MFFKNIFRISLKLMLFVAVLAGLIGCVAGGGVVVVDPYPSAEPKIPKGHMPPPGKCRIWYPDRPPGHQPPPGDCSVLRHRVPPGAWLIQGR